MNGRLRRATAAAAAAALLLLAGACTTVNPATGERDFTPLMGPAQERQIGAQEHPKIIDRFGGVYDDPEIGGWVAEVGGRLVANSELADQPFTFTVLDTPQVNAFAVPGGYVYVTRGLLALANTEAELAGVLAHEIGHVTARHTAQRYNRAVAGSLLTGLLGAVSGSRELAQLGELVGAGVLAHYSREQEYESDLLGVRYMSRAGYNPRAQADFLSSLGREDELQRRIAGDGAGETPLSDFFASHPNTVDRVRRAIAAADATGAAGTAPYRREELLRRIDGLVYGDSAAHGFVRGRTFAHPRLGFTFTVPEGFRLVNRPEAVYARGPDASLVRFDSAAKPRSSDPLRYLLDEWAPSVPLAQVERITINGLPAATATASARTRDGPRDLRLIVIRLGSADLYRFLILTPPSLTARLAEGLQRMTYSFHGLSAAAAAALRPYRISVVTAGPGDTAESLAARMALPEHKVEHFRVLNALAPGEHPRAGERVKLVSGG